MNPENLTDKPKEMDVKTGPGGLIGIVIIIVIILLAGIYVFMNLEKTSGGIENTNQTSTTTDEVTDENVNKDVASLDTDLSTMNGDLSQMETELNTY